MSLCNIKSAGFDDAVGTTAGAQPRQIMVALASLAFSRIHHSVLVNRSSGVSFFAVPRTVTSPGSL
jgi:hypothetical protein